MRHLLGERQLKLWGNVVQAFPAIARSHMAKKAQLLGIWLRAMLDFRERESCFLLTDVRPVQ